MRQLFRFLFSICFIIPLNAAPQSIFNKITDRAKQTAERKILNKTERAVEKTMDGKPVSKSSEKPANKNHKEIDTVIVAENTKTKSINAYDTYDFLAGEKIIYHSDFTGDIPGELASGWNTNGSGAVSSIKDIDGKWLRLAQEATYLPIIDLATSESFTVEFDLILDFNFSGYGFPEIKFGLLSTGKKAAGDNILLTDQQSVKNVQVDILPGFQGRTFIAFASHQKGSRHFHIASKPYNQLEKHYQQVSHVAMHCQGERLRLWINGDKIIDVPKAIPVGPLLNQLYFITGSSNYSAEQVGIFLANIRVANGEVNPRNKLLTEGVFVTSGILFDVNTSAIKPESNGILLNISKLLQENPEIKILVTGHTDSDGNAAANQQLSVKRAESVKAALVARGISSDRIQTAGKGSSAPLTANSSPETKARNRRVEFKRL